MGVVSVNFWNIRKKQETQAVIEFAGVCKKYPSGYHALNNISFKINKGEFVFIVGPSGAGKSTITKLILHEEKANSGEVTVNGFKMSELKPRQVPYFRRTMGFVFQDFRIIDKMTVFDNVAFTLRVTGASKKEIKNRVTQALNIVGLSSKAKERPDNISGGERQRVALARALVHSPKLIIADEPTGNIDPKMAYDIVKLLDEINRRGITVVMVTHAHDLVRKFNKRVIMLDRGEVVADDYARFVMDKPHNIYRS